MNVVVNENRGFTLIEMLVSLSIFSLILLMAYQSLVSSAQATLRVSQSVVKQSELRSARRTLSNAFNSRANFNGNGQRLTIDLSTGDGPWLAGTKRIEFVINDDQSLWAYLDDDSQGSRLVAFLDGAEFRYLDNDLSRTTWNLSRQPESIELSWVERGASRHWRFVTQ